MQPRDGKIRSIDIKKGANTQMQIKSGVKFYGISHFVKPVRHFTKFDFDTPSSGRCCAQLFDVDSVMRTQYVPINAYHSTP